MRVLCSVTHSDPQAWPLQRITCKCTPAPVLRCFDIAATYPSSIQGPNSAEVPPIPHHRQVASPPSKSSLSPAQPSTPSKYLPVCALHFNFKPPMLPYLRYRQADFFRPAGHARVASGRAHCHSAKVAYFDLNPR
uniref:Uncharacterized protein n=1 Tax=Panagrellus redivivus TaxID=6233 RepID=A0A7E4UMS3_PANRE